MFGGMRNSQVSAAVDPKNILIKLEGRWRGGGLEQRGRWEAGTPCWEFMFQRGVAATYSSAHGACTPWCNKGVCVHVWACMCVYVHARLGQLLLSCFRLKKRLEKGSLWAKYWGCKLALLGNYSCHPAGVTFLFSWVLLLIFLICRGEAGCVYHRSAGEVVLEPCSLCPQPPACGGLPRHASFHEH